MFWKKTMARKDTNVESEYDVPADEVVQENPQPLKPLFKKRDVVEPQQESQITIVTENQLIIEMLKNLNAKVDEILVIAKQ
jgi:hypothetical protein